MIACVSDIDAAELVKVARERDYSLGIVPRASHAIAQRLFALPKDPQKLFELACSDSPEAIDIAMCNDDVVLGMLMLGDTPFIDVRSRRYSHEVVSWVNALWLWLRAFGLGLRNLFGIHPFPLTLTTGRDVALNTVITGLAVIENEVRGPASRLVNTSISVQDGKISVVIIAPKSIVEYLWFLLVAVFPSLQRGSRLPGALSYIKTDG